MKSAGWVLVAFAITWMPQAVVARGGAPAPSRGMDTTPRHALDDLRKIMNCRRDSSVSCTPVPYTNFYDVSIEAKDSRIQTVEAMIQYNDGDNAVLVDRKSLPTSKRQAMQLVHYFMPRWKGAMTWTGKAIDHSLKLCAIVTRHDGITILIYPWHPADIKGHFLKLIVTRSNSIEPFPYNDYDCLVRTDNP